MRRIAQGSLATALFVAALSQIASAEIRTVDFVPTGAAVTTLGYSDLKSGTCNAGPQYAPALSDVSLFAPQPLPDGMEMSPACMPTVATRFVSNHLFSLVRAVSVQSSRSQAKVDLVVHF